MTAESMRERFESHIIRLNACTRLARQSDSVGGRYRTASVERAWQLWHSAMMLERERCAKVCDGMSESDFSPAQCAEAIRKG